MSASIVERNTIIAYGGLATPLAMIGYPIAIWLIPFYAEVVGIPLYIIANLLLIARFTDVITDPILGQLGDSTKTSIGRRKPWIIIGVPLMMFALDMFFIPGGVVSLSFFVMDNIIASFLVITLSSISAASIWDLTLDTPGINDITPSIPPIYLICLHWVN